MRRIFCRPRLLLENRERDTTSLLRRKECGPPVGLSAGPDRAAAFVGEVRRVWGPDPAHRDWVPSWGLTFLVCEMGNMGSVTPIRRGGRVY